MIPIRLAHWNLQALELDLIEVGQASGLDLQGRATISYEESVQLWQAAERLLDDPTVGHRSGAAFRLNELGAIGALMAHAPNLGSALDNLTNAIPLVLPGVFTIERDAMGAVITYERPTSSLASRHGVESIFASLLALARHCTRRKVDARRVAFANLPPGRGRETYDQFYGVPVEWRTSTSVLVLDHEVLELPLVSADPALNALVLSNAKTLLPQPERSNVERRVSHVLLSAPNIAVLTLAATARELGVSQRTLQRELHSAGVSFRSLQSEVRRQRAEQLLRDGRLSVEQIAERLGFQSRAGFDRAFRAWHGTTPADYRRQLRT